MQSSVLTAASAKSRARLGGLKKTADLLEKLMSGVFTICGFISAAFVLIKIGRASCRERVFILV